MKIAISTDNGEVSAHFGRCPEFTIVEIDGEKIVYMEVIPNPGHEPGFLPKFLAERGVKKIIAGGMGARAQTLFSEEGILSVVGVAGKVEDVIKNVASGKLQGGESLCTPGGGRGYGINKTECDHAHDKE